MALKASALKLSKKSVIVLIVLTLAVLILIALAIFLLTRSSVPIQNIQLEYADDSEAALSSITQPYDLTDVTPTFDIYGEEGFNTSDAPVVLIRTDYSPDADPCTQSDNYDYDLGAYDPNNGRCAELGRDNLTLPNHATVQIYSNYYKEDYHNGYAIDYSAYAFLPDGSVVSLTNNSKVQFNFYDNETRIVQMEGDAYYRVKAQAEGNIFTVQVGDRLIELSDDELVITMDSNDIANDNDLEELNEIYVEQKSKGGPLDSDTETIARLQANNLIANIYVISGGAGIRTRDNSDGDTTAINEESPYQRLLFKDYGKRITNEPDSEELAEAQETFLEYSSYATNQMKFSMTSYGLGNFNSVSFEDLYNMLMIRFDGIQVYAYNYSMAYMEDMENFNSEWNNFVSRISTCREGWYKATDTKCCPNDYQYNESTGSCTKTTYYYTCDEGWTLGSDNMCHRQVAVDSGEDETKTPTYYPSSDGNGDMCVTKSKPASYQLCSMAVSIGDAHMEGSSCCFDTEVAEPQLEPVN